MGKDARQQRCRLHSPSPRLPSEGPVVSSEHTAVLPREPDVPVFPPCLHSLPMSSDFQHYSFRMPNIGFQNLPLNIYIVVFGTAIFVFILSLLFCCYLIR